MDVEYADTFAVDVGIGGYAVDIVGAVDNVTTVFELEPRKNHIALVGFEPVLVGVVVAYHILSVKLVANDSLIVDAVGIACVKLRQRNFSLRGSHRQHRRGGSATLRNGSSHSRQSAQCQSDTKNIRHWQLCAIKKAPAATHQPMELIYSYLPRFNTSLDRA